MPPPPPSPVPPNRRLAAVVFTDIEGFTSITNQDEPAALSLIAEQNAIVVPLLATYDGRRVKSIGDGLLLEFPNALDALECMVRVQEAIRTRNANDREPALRLRVGVHLGDVVGEGEDILGDSVNIASRIEALSEPGGVCLSGPVFDSIREDPRFADLLRKARLPTTIGWRRAESRIRDPK